MVGKKKIYEGRNGSIQFSYSIRFIYRTIPENDALRLYLKVGVGHGFLERRKRIVEQHEGEISVQSKLGEGTTITFKLPIYEPAS